MSDRNYAVEHFEIYTIRTDWPVQVKLPRSTSSKLWKRRNDTQALSDRRKCARCGSGFLKYNDYYIVFQERAILRKVAGLAAPARMAARIRAATRTEDDR
jgi:hypothetical protein